MSKWQPIETAKRDGSTVHVRRVHDGRVVYEGPAVWRKQHFAALPPHPIDGDIYAPAYEGEGWMHVAEPKRVPEPTEWLPADA